MQNKTIYRSDYTPYPFVVLSIHLSVDLYADHALVTSLLSLKREQPGNLCLYGEGLRLVSLHMNDIELSKSEYCLRGGNLIIDPCPDELTLTIVTRLHPEKNTSLSGLYCSNQLFCTQCEAEGFRCITFFPDRPDVMTTYTTRISALKSDCPILLSNGNLVEKGETNDGRHWAVWHDPFKKPSYLFALVAGKLACVADKFITQSGKSIDLRIYVEPGNEDKCEHAMTSLKKAMRWDEEQFGREYDLDTFMIVAVSDFNFGAMENKGLTIFDSKYILARAETATDHDYTEIENVIGHEYFHNWTGNRITCRDWFQLSLKEGLTLFRDQEFSSDMNSREVRRIYDVTLLRDGQFPEDSGGMAHAVRPESYEAINNFYTETVYNKGAEIIRMQKTLVGDVGFRRGMDLYFERHDGQAVTIDDFVAAMEAANHVDLTQFKRWYSQAGTPEVTVMSDYKDNRLTLTFTQTCPPTAECFDKKPFHIPIRMALFDAKGQMVEESLLELKDEKAQFQFDGLSDKPIISLLRGFSAPILLHQTQTEDELLALLQVETDGYAKWNAGQILALNTLSTWKSAFETTWEISPKLIQAIISVLYDQSLDAALCADLLTPPSFETVMTHFSSVDVHLIETMREAYRVKLGKALFSHLEAVYTLLWKHKNDSMEPNAYGPRKLRNECLWLMMKADEAAALPYCQQQYEAAHIMTDKDASFSLLVTSTNDAISKPVIHAFYTEWSHNDLVLDKWFAAQALSQVPDVLDRVKALLNHPAFQMTNPNKAHALVGTFCEENHRYFHAEDGSGYVFLREILLQLDAINPQVAVQLATPLTLWQRVDASRQQLMRKELEILAAHKLSPDLAEIVSKSLAV
jgi:aminopeptidase N